MFPIGDSIGPSTIYMPQALCSGCNWKIGKGCVDLMDGSGPEDGCDQYNIGLQWAVGRHALAGTTFTFNANIQGMVQVI